MFVNKQIQDIRVLCVDNAWALGRVPGPMRLDFPGDLTA